MRHLARLGILGFVGTLTLSGCGPLLDRSHVFRAIRWMDADMDDLHRFPSRAIANGGVSVAFTDGASPVYDSVFGPVGFSTDEGELTQPLDEFLGERDTYALIVLRRDTLLYERYFGGTERTSVNTTFSVSKSLVSLATGIAIARGDVPGVHARVAEWVPELVERDARFADLTVEHLLTMTSGVAFTRSKMPWGDEARSYYSPDLRDVALTRSLDADPGTRFQYDFYSPIVLGLVLERATGRSLSSLLEEGVWSRIGADLPASWSLDSERSGFEKMESGFNATALDLARLGRLYLHGGGWEGEQIVPDSWVAASVRPDTVRGRAERYGYAWHLGQDDEARPRYWAEGRFGQFVYVVPHLDLVMVRTGRTDGDVGWRSLFERFARRIEAVDHAAAPSPEGVP